ncbi:MAG: hypothetical protein ACRD8W_01120 [Nitrososphaeraceae archaeon]
MSLETSNPSGLFDTSSSAVQATVDSITSIVKRDSRTGSTVSREVGTCLTACAECTGVYIDAIDGKRLRIVCRHHCHKGSGGKPDNAENQ